LGSDISPYLGCSTSSKKEDTNYCNNSLTRTEKEIFGQLAESHSANYKPRYSTLLT
jgi:hypothetical protein